jgi:uncharacterized cofD-like protein
VPNLLVQGVPRAIRNSRALKAYFVNLMWQPGETHGFDASDHVRAIYEHAGMPMLDVVIVNTTPIRQGLLKKYAAQRASPVVNDAETLERMGVRLVGAPLAVDRDLVRHDSDASAAIAVRLAVESRQAINQ